MIPSKICIAIFLLLPILTYSQSCGSFCTFNLCSRDNTLPVASPTLLTAPRRAVFPYICRNNTEIGQVLSNAETLVFHRNRYIPISEWRPKGLDSIFPRNFFRVSQIPFTPWSGAARSVVKGNQWKYLHGRCFVMPITKFETLDEQERAKPVTIERKRENCVAFRATAATISMELIWNSGDDFDLHVVQPNGERIYYSNTQTESGTFTGDITSSCSTNLKFGRENILYLPGRNIEKGTYTIRVHHFSNCNRIPTAWRLTVMVDGVLRLRRSGVSTVGDDTVISEGRIEYV